MTAILNTGMILNPEHGDAAECDTYPQRPPILTFRNSPGVWINISIDEDLPVEEQLQIAAQIINAAGQFYDATHSHYRTAGAP